MDVVSLRELSITLPKILIGFALVVGMAVPLMLNWNLPFLSTIALNLECILVHSTSFLSPCRIYWQPGTVSVVTVLLSMNALLVGRLSFWALCILVQLSC